MLDCQSLSRVTIHSFIHNCFIGQKRYMYRAGDTIDSKRSFTFLSSHGRPVVPFVGYLWFGLFCLLAINLLQTYSEICWTWFGSKSKIKSWVSFSNHTTVSTVEQLKIHIPLELNLIIFCQNVSKSRDGIQFFSDFWLAELRSASPWNTKLIN